MADPANIRLRTAREEFLGVAAQNVHEMRKSTAVATWHAAKQDRPAASARDAEAAAAVIEGDLKPAAQQLTTVRRERLRTLYAAEMKGWQDELAARGLIIETSLD